MQQAPKTDLTRILTASFFIVALAVGSVWVLSAFLPSLIWATMIVVATWSLMMKLAHSLGGRRKLAATIMSLALAAIVLIPLGIAVTALFAQGHELLDLSRNWSQVKIPPPPDWLSKLPVRGEALTAEWQRISDAGMQSLTPQIQPYVRKFAAWMIASVGSVGIFIVHLIVTLVLAGILYANGETATNGITLFSRRLAGKRGEDAVILAGKSIKSVALGIIVTALVQTALAGAGLWAASVPYAGILTAAVLVLCIAQIGPLLPLLCGVGWLYFKDQNTVATVLLIWSLAVGVLDNFLRPMLIKRGADLPFLLILAGVLGGLLAFGVMGLFIGPVVLAVTYTLLKSWVLEGPAEEVDWPKPTPTYRTETEQYPTEI